MLGAVRGGAGSDGIAFERALSVQGSLVSISWKHLYIFACM